MPEVNLEVVWVITHRLSAIAFQINISYWLTSVGKFKEFKFTSGQYTSLSSSNMLLSKMYADTAPKEIGSLQQLVMSC